MPQGGIRIIKENLKDHPQCAHGPTILFSRLVGKNWRNFYACSACRSRKECPFFMWEDDQHKISNSKKNEMQNEKLEFARKTNHRKLFVLLNQIKQLPIGQRHYCHTCSQFELPKYQVNHLQHEIVNNLSDDQLLHPSELLRSLTNSKKEAQYLFSKSTVQTIVGIFEQQGYSKVICICAPRIHEFIQSDGLKMDSLLLDIDKRYLHFFSPLQCCWYNCFNHYFFMNQAEQVFLDYLRINSGEGLAIIMDPPFGGRVELLADTLEKINKLYKSINNITIDIPIFWVFPYFMEPYIINTLPKFTMLDYKVNYENHSLFKVGPKGRKQGSPIRIFTNIHPRCIKLPAEEGYKYCQHCDRWIASENRHCRACNSCTSKDGRTYVHCKLCKRCVKPTWSHCTTCNTCIIRTHACKNTCIVKGNNCNDFDDKTSDGSHVKQAKRKIHNKVARKKQRVK